jgi:MarR family 2-MHQ and catechol resistance regulon transcriptional repressor
MANRTTSQALPVLKDPRLEYYWTKVHEFGRKYEKFNWPSVEILLNFISTYDMLMGHFSKRMSAYNLSPAMFNVLMILSRGSEKKFKQHDISKLLFVSRANVTGLVNTLARKGLVKRKADPKDRRAWLITITRKGKALLEAYLPHHYAEVDRIFSGIKPAEKKELNRLICKLKQGIQ